jgi:hypothetical protein
MMGTVSFTVFETAGTDSLAFADGHEAARQARHETIIIRL